MNGNKKKRKININGDTRESTIISGDNNVVNNTKIVIKQEKKSIYLYLVVAIIIIISSWFVWEYYLKYDTSYMGGQLNIVIEPFLEEKNGYLQKSDKGLLLAQYFYSQLKNDITSGQFEKETNIRLEVRDPQSAPPLRYVYWVGTDNAAQTVSEKVNAHIIIYGIIKYDEFNRQYLSIQFYISPDQFGDAQEILGENELGNPILLSGDPKSGMDIEGENEEIRNRIIVVSLLMKAIGAYVGEDFEKSLQYLESGLEDSLWKQTTGREVIYLLAGNVTSRQALPILLKNNQEEALEIISKSETYYQQALLSAQPKGEYARAYIGLAGVQNFYALYEARLSNNYADINLDSLEKQEEYLDLALLSNYQSPSADIEEKVAFNRAQVFLLRSQLLNNPSQLLSQSEDNYKIVIESYELGNKRLRELAAHSYSGLALISRSKNHQGESIERYLKAIEITRIPSLQALYLYHIGNVYYEVGDFQNALKYYSIALDMKEDLLKRVSAEQVQIIENRIIEIQSILQDN